MQSARITPQSFLSVIVLMVVIFVVLELLAPERNVISKPSYLGMPTIHSAASIVSGERSLTIVGRKKINSKRQRAEILGADLQ